MLLQNENYIEERHSNERNGSGTFKGEGLKWDEGFKLCWDKASQTLLFEKNGFQTPVAAKPCFPWSQPLEKISLRDYDGNEKAFIAKAEELDKESEMALMSALKEACFYFSIERILSIKDEFELRVWIVETQQGLRTFQTKLTGWPTQVGPTRYIVRDVHKDLFVIENYAALDKSSQALFWPLSEE